MKHTYLFEKTREISLTEFESIWAQGGFSHSGGQFSNYNQWCYMWTVDPEKAAKQKAEQAAYDEWSSSVPKETGSFGIGTQFVHHSDWVKSFKWREELEKMSPIVNNIADRFDAGWVLGEKLPATRTTDNVQPLPQDWEECFLEAFAYPHGTVSGVLAARNNKDGTVQLFRV